MKTFNELLSITLKKGLKPAPKTTVSQWAATKFYLPSTSAEPGLFKLHRTPYLKEIMDAFNEENIRRVVVKSAAQMGKSSALLAIIGYYVENNPCSIMLVQPTVEMAEDFSKDRLNRMIQDSGSLTPLFYDLNKSRSGNQTILSKFFTGGRIVLQGANSPAGLASRPIKILLCDEVDRFPASAGTEGDPINLAAKRTTTFWDSKIGLFSTPTVENESRIDVEYLLGTQEQWCHACPNCGEYHFLKLGQMVTDYDETLDSKNNRVIVVNSVKWRCPDCGSEFTQAQMKDARQKFIMENPAAMKNGIRSFHINGFSGAWLNWKEILREYYEARGNPAREAVVYNTRFGESYELKGDYNDGNEFLIRREVYEAEIPCGVLILTCAVDVQANRLEYEICGWGSGEECWHIAHNIIRGAPNDAATWQALDAVISREYTRSDHACLKIARTFIDSGYSARLVYEYCAVNQFKGVFPVKGNGGAGLNLIHKYHYVKNTPLILTILGVNDGKQEIFSRLAIEKPGAMYIHFPQDDNFLIRNYDENYFKQLTAERRVIKRSGGILYSTFETITAKARNEALDLAVYGLAALKSLIDNDKNFFEKLAQAPAKVVKPARRKTQNIDIWS